VFSYLNYFHPSQAHIASCPFLQPCLSFPLTRILHISLCILPALPILSLSFNSTRSSS
jgi:hypothetical protein